MEDNRIEMPQGPVPKVTTMGSVLTQQRLQTLLVSSCLASLLISTAAATPDPFGHSKSLGNRQTDSAGEVQPGVHDWGGVQVGFCPFYFGSEFIARFKILMIRLPGRIALGDLKK